MVGDPARLYELNCQRRLPDDHPSADPHADTYGDTNTGTGSDEDGVRRREPRLTTPVPVRRLYQYVASPEWPARAWLRFVRLLVRFRVTPSPDY